MELILPETIVKEITLHAIKKFQVNESRYQWHKQVTIPLIYFKKEDIIHLREIITQIKKSKEKDNALTTINNHLEMIENPLGKIRTVEMGVTAMIGYIGISSGYRVYIKNPNNEKYYAYRVTSIHYEPPSGYNRRHVELSLAYDQFGARHTESITFYSEDLRGMTVVEAFDRRYIFIESIPLRETYLQEKETFNQMYLQVGEQYILNGTTTDDTPDNIDRYESSRFDSIHHRVVIDVFRENEKQYRHSKTDRQESTVDVGLAFWKKQSKNYQGFAKENQNEKYTKQIEIPVHSDVIIFDLKRHMRLICHTDFLKKYQYLDNMEDSLVIRPENKLLIKNLVNHSNDKFNDIIRDKSGGLLVMLVGPPGVGKTLTAEVYAEIQKKPLYAVQSSQLGVEPDVIEKELKLYFERSIRWNAILLIDEADVYVHKRTTDLKQNAIVGTFLRVLEYYPGILFMTSNRAEIIDDAIISRCIVLVQYSQPTIPEQEKIWKVLAESLHCTITNHTIHEIVEEFCKFSGRDIKNVLKLCKISHGEKPVTFEMVQQLVQYIPRFGVKSEK